MFDSHIDERLDLRLKVRDHLLPKWAVEGIVDPKCANVRYGPSPYHVPTQIQIKKQGKQVEINFVYIVDEHGKTFEMDNDGVTARYDREGKLLGYRGHQDDIERFLVDEGRGKKRFFWPTKFMKNKMDLHQRLMDDIVPKMSVKILKMAQEINQGAVKTAQRAKKKTQPKVKPVLANIRKGWWG